MIWGQGFAQPIEDEPSMVGAGRRVAQQKLINSWHI